MIVQLRLDLDDNKRKAVRRALGHKGGLATRKEVTAWAMRLLEDFSAAAGAQVKASEAHTVGMEPPTPENDPVGRFTPDRSDRRSGSVERFRAAENAPAEAVCKHCGKAKDRHGRMGYSCPAGHYTVFEMTLEVPGDAPEVS